MMDLASLQQAFQAYVLNGEGPIAEHVQPGRLTDGDARLRTYFEAYRLRLIEALETDYEALHALMGEGAFRAACAAYVEATPSAFRNVRWYGGGLSQYLHDTLPWSAKPWLSDLARFEWTLTLAFDAPDAPALDFERMAALPAQAWSTLCLRLHPSVQLLALRSNAPAIRQAVEAGVSPPAVALHERAIPWLVWRRSTSVGFRSLSQAERCALAAASSGVSFASLCEGLCEWVPSEQAPAIAAGWLRSWVDDGLICGVAAQSASEASKW
jgi:hypothetical protein